MYIIQTNGLCHQFGRGDRVVNELTLRVPQGSIYGFFGPNGAGKTTTLKLILGLIKKQTGQIHIYGKPLEQNRVSILKQIGSLIDSPSLYGHLTAVENLLVFQKLYQCRKERIDQVLELVGLSRTADKKVGRFSLGMKQRLGIAIALLHNPSFLILDEPTNGLDPSGMLEIREMLSRMNQQHGISILVSSHLLSEMEKLVSHVGIINKGQLIYEGALDDLMAKSRQTSKVIWNTSNAAKAMETLSGRHNAEKLDENKLITPNLPKSQIDEMNRELLGADVSVYSISGNNKDLESIFIDLIGN
ncbi:ABC transporter ATP-binding protein [Dyadobacter pollutisoli]|uniref:ABC transporter ATP-binding protein n=1 Tax=Dyadobacter pollutisoli TaxID=2910158 RepID=A0A9E8N9L7_9BACT|nr:ABC transporter ATP-binding protein [Dyadobacter pollutisoli]WAC12514.1 ABC transporter ATP-binding protein [Dyadobacter pollutisoli]